MQNIFGAHVIVHEKSGWMFRLLDVNRNIYLEIYQSSLNFEAFLFRKMWNIWRVKRRKIRRRVMKFEELFWKLRGKIIKDSLCTGSCYTISWIWIRVDTSEVKSSVVVKRAKLWVKENIWKILHLVHTLNTNYSTQRVFFTHQNADFVFL